MTENKRFKHSEFQQDDGQYQYYGIEDTEKNYVYNVIGDGIYDISEELLINCLNELSEENKQLKEQNKKLTEIIYQIFEAVTKLDGVRKEYCNALFRILGEVNDVDKAKKRIKEFLENV